MESSIISGKDWLPWDWKGVPLYSAKRSFSRIGAPLNGLPSGCWSANARASSYIVWITAFSLGFDGPEALFFRDLRRVVKIPRGESYEAEEQQRKKSPDQSEDHASVDNPPPGLGQQANQKYEDDDAQGQ